MMKQTVKSANERPAILISFVALSLVVHGLFLLVQTVRPITPKHISLGSTSLYISLPSTDKATNISFKPADKRQFNPLQEQDIKHISHNANSSQNAINFNKPASAQKDQQGITQNARQQNFLLGAIRHRLSQYLNYPDRARRRGWEGNVTIGFHIDKHGFLHNVHLTQTSGYNLLDSAALNAIGKVKSISLLPWFKDPQNRIFQPTALQLPIRYQLTKS